MISNSELLDRFVGHRAVLRVRIDERQLFTFAGVVKGVSPGLLSLVDERDGRYKVFGLEYLQQLDLSEGEPAR